MSKRTQIFHGEVSGYVAGRDMHVYGGVQRPDWWSMERRELLYAKALAARHAAKARLRMFLNLPMVVWMLLMCGGLAAAAWNVREGIAVLRGLQPANASNQTTAFGLTMAFMVAVLVLSKWVISLQRPERAVIRSAMRDVDEIEVVLRRREW